MEEYKSNAIPEPDDITRKKRVEKVISGGVRTKKKGVMERIVGLILPEGVRDSKSYIVSDIIVPLVKDAIYDTVYAILYPNGGGNRSRRGSSSSYQASYQPYYARGSDRRDRDRGAPRQQEPRPNSSYEDIVFESRGDAEKALYQLEALITQYHVASIIDYYDAIGKTESTWADAKYGWTDVRTAEVIRIRDGFVIRLPKALPLD